MNDDARLKTKQYLAELLPRAEAGTLTKEEQSRLAYTCDELLGFVYKLYDASHYLSRARETLDGFKADFAVSLGTLRPRQEEPEGDQ